LTAEAALDGKQTPIDIADTFYGTHFGDLQGWAQGCYTPRSTVHPGTPARTPERVLNRSNQARRRSMRRIMPRWMKASDDSSLRS
jgi:hypothetical protein